MTFIDDLIQKVQAQSEHGEPEAASPINLALEIFAGTALEGDIAAIGDLVTAIQNGDLTQFLSQNEIGSAEVEAIGRLIDAISAPADKSRQDRLKREAAGITIEAPKADLLKQQLGEAAATSTGSIVTSKEYRSPKAAYDALIKEIREANDGEVPEGTPTFDEWLRLNRITSSAVIPKGTSLTMTPYKTYVGKTGDTFRSIAESQNVDLAELMKINGVTDPEASASGAKLIVPAPKALSSTGGRGEQTQPESQPGYDPSKPSTEPSTDPGDPGGPGTVQNPAITDNVNLNPLENALNVGFDQFAYDALRDKGWSADAISQLGPRLPQMDAVRFLTDLVNYQGGGTQDYDAIGGATNVLNDYLNGGGSNYGGWMDMLGQIASGDLDQQLGMEPAELLSLIGNLNYGRYSRAAQNVLFGGNAARELQRKWDTAQTTNPTQTLLEYILSQMGA